MASDDQQPPSAAPDMEDVPLKTEFYRALLKTVGILAVTVILFSVAIEIEPEVECSSGESISYWFTNDGWEDCADGSDETPAAEDWEVHDNAQGTWILFFLSLVLLVKLGIPTSR